MPVIPEPLRVSELQKLGLSRSLIRLASGDCVHPLFNDFCLGPPFYVYHGAGTPAGPVFVPLWDHCDTVTGVWEQPSGVEFLDFGIEDANYEPRVLARTEQGFWTTRFNFYSECLVPVDELRKAAVAVGFRFLDRLLCAEDIGGESLRSFQGHEVWLRELVTSVDRDSRNQVG